MTRRVGNEGLVAREAAAPVTPARARRRGTLAPYLFLLPFFLIYTVFLLYPVLSALRLSFYEAQGLGGERFVGLDNYIDLFQDPRYLQALRNTTLYAMASVFILSPLALLAAIGIRSFIVPSPNWQSFYRIAIFLPFITSFVVIALMFALIFETNYGLVNGFLASIGLPRPNWLRSTNLALPTIIMVAIWTYIGINSLYFLAGLQNIPGEIYEAAAIDGASAWRIFWSVTIPLLRPTILFVVIQATIFSYQIFEIPYLLTGGGPSDATLTLSIYLYQIGFSQFDRGYASAIGYSITVIAVTLSMVQLWFFRKSND